MNSAAEMIEVMCPRCGDGYLDWNLPEQEPGSTATCPRCGYDPAGDRLLRENGAWVLVPEDDEVLER